MKSPIPSATVVIVTKDRKDSLRLALRSVVEQSIAADVLVIDDGSSDGTTDMVRQEFPSISLHRSDTPHGYIRQRNRGAQLATTDIIVSIDDDAVLGSPDTLSITLSEFEDGRVGAVAIPFVNVRQSPAVRQLAPDRKRIYVTDQYIGTAHAIRRELFLQLGGYRPFLFHQGEEMDLCLRLLEAGYVTRLGSAPPISHFESPIRDTTRIDHYTPRNTILHAWYNAPWVYLPTQWLGSVVRIMQSATSRRRLRAAIWGTLCGFGACARQIRQRQAVRFSSYRLYRRLKRCVIVPLDEISLPTLAPKPKNLHGNSHRSPPKRSPDRKL